MRKITKWINSNFSSSLKDRDFNKITEFLLLWNLFEDRLFSSQFTIEEAENYINNNVQKFDPCLCNKIFYYFQNHYAVNAQSGTLFLYDCCERLNFRRNDRKEFVDTTLSNENSTLKDKMLASLIIVYRYRNNLFHGLKDITQINYQQDNFTYANKLLKVFIGAYISTT